MASLKYQRAVYWFGLQILKIGTMIKDESKFGQKQAFSLRFLKMIDSGGVKGRGSYRTADSYHGMPTASSKYGPHMANCPPLGKAIAER